METWGWTITNKLTIVYIYEGQWLMCTIPRCMCMHPWPADDEAPASSSSSSSSPAPAAQICTNRMHEAERICVGAVFVQTLARMHPWAHGDLLACMHMHAACMHAHTCSLHACKCMHIICLSISLHAWLALGLVMPLPAFPTLHAQAHVHITPPTTTK